MCFVWSKSDDVSFYKLPIKQFIEEKPLGDTSTECTNIRHYNIIHIFINYFVQLKNFDHKLWLFNTAQTQHENKKKLFVKRQTSPHCLLPDCHQ